MQTCLTCHTCNYRCHGNIHVDVGYDSRLHHRTEDMASTIWAIQELHDRVCGFELPHYLTVLSIAKATEPPEMEDRYPEEAVIPGIESRPFLFTYEWGVLTPRGDHAQS